MTGRAAAESEYQVFRTLVLLTAVSGLLTGVLGPNILSMAVFTVAVAVYAALDRWRLVLGLAGCAALSSLIAAMVVFGMDQALSVSGATVAMMYALAALVGAPTGYGILRCWRFDRVVLVTTLVALALVAGNIALHWKSWNQQSVQSLDQVIAYLDDIQSTSGAQADVASARADVFRMVRTNWDALAFGLVVANTLAGACLLVVVTTRWLQALEVPGPVGTFATMRPPDWFIWLGIGAAALWLLDHQWPHQAARIVSWNAAVALGFVYWLNGLSVLLYGVRAFSGYRLRYVVALLVLFLLGQALFVVGIFDTWGDFRRKLDILADRIRQQRKSLDDDR